MLEFLSNYDASSPRCQSRMLLLSTPLPLLRQRQAQSSPSEKSTCYLLISSSAPSKIHCPFIPPSQQQRWADSHSLSVISTAMRWWCFAGEVCGLGGGQLVDFNRSSILTKPPARNVSRQIGLRDVSAKQSLVSFHVSLIAFD